MLVHSSSGLSTSPSLLIRSVVFASPSCFLPVNNWIYLQAPFLEAQDTWYIRLIERLVYRNPDHTVRNANHAHNSWLHFLAH